LAHFLLPDEVLPIDFQNAPRSCNVSLGKLMGVEADNIVEERLNLLGMVEFVADFFGSDDQMFFDYVVGNLKIVFSHALECFLTNNSV
jgi:hypothetical protein